MDAGKEDGGGGAHKEGMHITVRGGQGEGMIYRSARFNILTTTPLLSLPCSSPTARSKTRSRRSKDVPPNESNDARRHPMTQSKPSARSVPQRSDSDNSDTLYTKNKKCRL